MAQLNGAILWSEEILSASGSSNNHIENIVSKDRCNFDEGNNTLLLQENKVFYNPINEVSSEIHNPRLIIVFRRNNLHL